MTTSWAAFSRPSRPFALPLPPQRQVDQLSQVSGRCMEDILHYAYDHLAACQLLLCCAEGTRYADLVDEMVAVEIQATHNYQDVLGSLGMPSPRIAPRWSTSWSQGCSGPFSNW